MVSDVAREFLLAEKRANRSFTDKDRINFNGVPVEFLSWSAQSPTLVTSPLQRKERDWRWALLALSAISTPPPPPPQCCSTVRRWWMVSRISGSGV